MTIPYTVAELIARLQQLPPSARVMIRGYEGGEDDVHHVTLGTAELDVHPEGYYGSHEWYTAGGADSERRYREEYGDPKGGPWTPAVLLSYNLRTEEKY